MLKNVSKLEFQVGEKVYQFLCDIDAPIEHARIALNEFQAYLIKLENDLKQRQQQQQESNQPKVE